MQSLYRPPRTITKTGHALSVTLTKIASLTEQLNVARIVHAMCGQCNHVVKVVDTVGA